jgi:hypothetical protein
MDLLKLIDTMSDAMRRGRTNYHLTLGELISKLKDSKKVLPVVFSDGGAPVEGNSYRGYYSDFSFERGESATAGGLQAYLEDEVLDKTFEGYKGGDFTMGEDTPLWVAPYGSTGLAIVDYKDEGHRVVLVTKDVD